MKNRFNPLKVFVSMLFCITMISPVLPAATAYATAPDIGTNVVPNGDFENGTLNGWDYTPGQFWNYDGTSEGYTHYAVLRHGGNPGDIYTASLPILEAIPSSAYACVDNGSMIVNYSMSVRQITPYPGLMQLRFINGEGAYLGISPVISPASETFSTVSGSCAVPAGTRGIIVILQNPYSAYDAMMAVSDISVVFSGDTTPPSALALNPSNGSHYIMPDGTYSIDYNEVMHAIAGHNITISDSGGPLRTIDVTDTSQVIIADNGDGTSEVQVQPTVPLSVDWFYNISVQAGAFTDASGNPCAEITGPTEWAFYTDRYIIHFDTQGGSPDPADQYWYAKDTVTRPSDPTKPGYVFDDWYTDTDFAPEHLYNFTDWVMSDLTLYAHWTLTDTTPPNLIDRMPAVGGRFTIPDTHIFLYFDENVVGVSGRSIYLTPEDGSTAVIDAGTVSVTGADVEIIPPTLEKNRTYYIALDAGAFTDLSGNPCAAIGPTDWSFDTDQCRVTFDPINGNPTWDVLVNCKTPVDKPSPDPTRSGYTFGGWYTNTDFAPEHLYDFSALVTDDTKLYAKWELRSTYLKGITITPGATLSPSTFSKTRYYYIVNLTEGTDSVTITPVPANSSATIKINNVMQSSITVNLEKGHTKYIYIKVSMSGKSSRTYMLYVKRAKSTVKVLSSLAATTPEGVGLSFTDKDDAGTIVTFNPDTVYYYLRLDEKTPSVKITPAKGDQYQKIYIDGYLRSSRTYTLSTGHSTTCTIKAVAQNSAHYKTYKVYISRAPSTNAYLKKLYTSSSYYPVTPVFNKDTGEYYVYLSSGRSYITLYATKESYYAKVKFDGTTTSYKKYYVANGAGKDAVITVYAQASTTATPVTRVYTVHILRAPAITSFSASPYYGSYPSISPGGDNRLTFKWYQKGAGDVTIETLNLSDPAATWQNIYSASALIAGSHTFEWDANPGSPPAVGKYKARIRITDEFGTSTHKYLYFKVLKQVTPTISASRSSITQGGMQYTKITAKWDVFTKVKVEVYDDSGVNLVATLLTPAYRYPDTRTLYWYGKYDIAHGGTAVPAGIYRIRVKAGDVTQEITVTITPIA